MGTVKENLMTEIKRLRKELTEKYSINSSQNNNNETIKLSCELDRLIVMYYNQEKDKESE